VTTSTPTTRPLVIGMLGGMSWESTIEYYRLANELVRDRLGGLHSARLVLTSLDFAEIEQLQVAGEWARAGQILAAEAARLEAAGADLLVLCTNTMHKVADEVQAAVSIPLLHLADTTAAAVRAAGMTTIGLLATGFTMEQDFYRDRLAGSTGSSTRSCASASCGRTPGRGTGRSSTGSSPRARRASSSAARRSSC
jgi:aspartate racemase